LKIFCCKFFIFKKNYYKFIEDTLFSGWATVRTDEKNCPAVWTAAGQLPSCLDSYGQIKFFNKTIEKSNLLQIMITTSKYNKQ
jgi:hypothetical protein